MCFITSVWISAIAFKWNFMKLHCKNSASIQSRTCPGPQPLGQIDSYWALLLPWDEWDAFTPLVSSLVVHIARSLSVVSTPIFSNTFWLIAVAVPRRHREMHLSPKIIVGRWVNHSLLAFVSFHPGLSSIPRALICAAQQAHTLANWSLII